MAEELLEKHGDDYLVFWCPGCQQGHSYHIGSTEPKWTWNGSMERPTFHPSLRVRYHGSENAEPRYRKGQMCHLFVREGRIQYCPDSTHELAGQTVDMEPARLW